MWFKSAQIFQLSKVSYDGMQMAEALSDFAFSPCLASLPSSYGWVSPFELEGAPLVHSANGYLLFCLQFEDKILPASVVKQELNEKLINLSQQYGRKISKKERLSIKDEVTQSLLIRAFSKRTRLYAYIDTKKNYLVLDTTSGTKTQKFIELLSRSIEGLELTPIETKKMPFLLTAWVKNQDTPKTINIEKSCVLRDPEQQHRVIRCQQQELSAEGVLSLIDDGCEVIQLACNWQDRVQFKLQDPFMLSGLRFGDELLAASKELGVESDQQRLDADFYIMTETLEGLFHDLLSEIETKAAIPAKEVLIFS